LGSSSFEPPQGLTGLGILFCCTEVSKDLDPESATIAQRLHDDRAVKMISLDLHRVR
jgi:hypothetical protein